MKINLWHSIEQYTVDASIDQRHSWLKTSIVPKANILNTWRKWVCVENEEKANLRDIYCN